MKILVALLVFAMSLPAFSQETSDTNIQTHYEPEGKIFVGQTVRLWVEIATSGTISTPPQYPELKVEGSIALLPEAGAVSFSNDTGIGLRQRYVIIPQREGSLEVPPLQIKIGTDHGSGEELQTLTVAPESLQAELPAGTEDIERIVTSSDMKVSESYDSDLTGLKAGDAITRTVTIVSGGTFALALPEINFEQIPGAKQYPATPQLSDTSNRGDYRATRVAAASYVFEKAGDITLPEISVQWFDLKKNAVQEMLLPAVDLTIAANPAFAEASAQATAEDAKTKTLHLLGTALVWLQKNIVALTIVAIGIYLFRLLWDRFSAPVFQAWRDHREKVLHSEKYAFKRFNAACRSGDADKCRNAFWRWLDHYAPAWQSVSLASLSHEYREVDTVEISNFLSADKLDGRNINAFKTAASKLRTGLLKGPATRRSTKSYSLNPSA
jgi:hypothetical protein